MSGLDCDIYKTNDLIASTHHAGLRLVSDSDARLRSIIATLEQSRAELVESANSEAAQILAMAILQLRMRLYGVAASELDVLCDGVLLLEAERSKKSGDSNNGNVVGRR
jgi:cell division protein FtsL